MRHRTKEWTKLAVRGQFNMDARAVIAGKEHYRITAPQISRSLATEPLSIGNCNAASLKLTVLLEEGETIPEAAEVKIIGRLTDLDIETSTEVLPFGIYWVDTCTQTENLYTLTCYDAMLKTSQAMVDEGDTGAGWPKSMTKVVQMIAERIGVPIDPRTRINQGAAYVVPYPKDYTMQQVLGWIGACNGGNWTITDEGQLRLVTLTAPPEETYHVVDSDYNDIITGSNDILAWKQENVPSRQVPAVGSSVSSPIQQKYPIVDHKFNRILTSDGFLLVYDETGTVAAEQGIINIPIVRGDLSKGKRLKVSGVLMTDEDGKTYAQGNDDGFVIEINGCPYACGSICADLYKMLGGIEYEPFTAPDAAFDPATELGDQVEISDKVHSSIYEMVMELDIGYACTISAPTDSETTRQYPYLKGREKKVEDALKNAAKAQETADNKSRTFTTVPVPPYSVGDFWTCGTDYNWKSGNDTVSFKQGEIYRAATTRLEGAFDGNDWVFASKYTDDTTANAAQKSADHAQASADAAQKSADKAQVSAEKAQSSADAAQTSADTANKAASAAQASADNAAWAAATANENAKAAQKSADDAQLSANAAQNSATEANKAAIKAQNAASVADGKAEEAKNSAKNAADSAKTANDAAAAADAAAKTAQGTANNAQDGVNSLTTRMGAAETTIKQTATDITFKASKTEAKGYADTAESNAKAAAAEDATSKANTAESNAKNELHSMMTFSADNGLVITHSGWSGKVQITGQSIQVIRGNNKVIINESGISITDGSGSCSINSGAITFHGIKNNIELFKNDATSYDAQEYSINLSAYSAVLITFRSNKGGTWFSGGGNAGLVSMIVPVNGVEMSMVYPWNTVHKRSVTVYSNKIVFGAGYERTSKYELGFGTSFELETTWEDGWKADNTKCVPYRVYGFM